MTFADRIHEPRFTTKEASEATGVNWETLRGWIKRKIILAEEEDDTRSVKAQGSPYLLSFTRVMQIAITARLDDVGIPPSRGGHIALAFTDLGKGASGWVGDSDSFDWSKARRPGHLYSKGLTVLTAYADEKLGYVFNVDGQNDPKLFEKMFFPVTASGKARVLAAVWIDPIFQELKLRLGVGDEA